MNGKRSKLRWVKQRGIREGKGKNKRTFALSRVSAECSPFGWKQFEHLIRLKRFGSNRRHGERITIWRDWRDYDEKAKISNWTTLRLGTKSLMSEWTLPSHLIYLSSVIEPVEVPNRLLFFFFSSFLFASSLSNLSLSLPHFSYWYDEINTHHLTHHFIIPLIKHGLDWGGRGRYYLTILFLFLLSSIILPSLIYHWFIL